MNREQLHQALNQLPEQLLALDSLIARERQAPWLARRDQVIRRTSSMLGRIERVDEPLLVVIAGGTGAGKSTLANTLAGDAVSATSARRPTTSSPTAIGQVADLEAVLRHGVLSAQSESGSIQAVPVESVPAGLVVVDSPDVDSIETANRDVAERLLEVADVWLWLATARTYADEAGMVYLRQAARLDVSSLIVLTQVSLAEADEIIPDLEDKLHEAGHRQVEIYVVPQVETAQQQLPVSAAAAVVERIRDLAPEQERAEHRWRTVIGGVHALPDELDELISEVETDRASVLALENSLEQIYGAVPQRVIEQLKDAAPLRYEVLRRWSELVGDGWLQRQLHAAASRFPRGIFDRLPFFGKRGEAIQQQAVEQAREGVAGLITEVLEHAAGEVESNWRANGNGRVILDRLGSPRASGEAAQYEQAQELVEAWEKRVAEHVATIGQEKLTQARRATTGINATVTSAAVVLFTLSGGLTLGEVALTAAGSTTTHTVLSRILGERNVNQLIEDIRVDLEQLIEGLAKQQAGLYRDLLEQAVPSDEHIVAVQEYRQRLGALQL
ncbi:50S ribosome-binding GTPase [Halorhodospira halochloris]|uniref:GTPase n=1 Tax=Halorhodospira halochloris TaxID=1052 RepID=UPI001EE7DF3D|nr:GTPase [Halorhodospira halochloris]MCG5530633.1 50S ribosome-binding GTPase [Halorhodospira halochloris]